MAYFFDSDTHGGKLEGLVCIPRLWVPPLFSISQELHARWLRDEENPRSKPNDLLDPVERKWIEQEVSHFGDQPEYLSLIVRSDAREEGLEQRGLLKSIRCDGTVEAIFSASIGVFKAASEARMTTPVSLIVQVYCPPILSGYLSNERRVSEVTRGWICEIASPTQFGKQIGSRVIRLRVEKAASATDRELPCSDRTRLVSLLRSVGRYFHDKKARRLLEWVWDGNRLWIVQNDHAPDPAGESPESCSQVSTHSLDTKALRRFRLFSSADAKRWQKLKCAMTFRSMNFPTAPLFVLNGARNIRELARDRPSADLISDLTEFCKSPLVIRTDIADQTTLFANRTDCVSSPDPAVRFMCKTAKELLNVGVAPTLICFIAHRFIPAHASAFSMATPNGTRVTVDALWGLPDGLEFCSHDSFEVDTRSNSLLGRKIRYKSTFLAALKDGSWKATPLGPPWDWKASIDDNTAYKIATLSRQLAVKLEEPVVVMWFARVQTESGYANLIPWRYTTKKEPKQIESVIGEYFLSEPFFVRNSTDLDILGRQTEPISSIILRPDEPHLRDISFLERLGTTVQAKGLRLDLEGSPLSHTYFVLKRTGAHVACVDLIKPKSLRRKFAKLVRDKIPVRIQTQGEKVLTINLPEGELLDVLKAKIVEEAMEVLSASSTDNLKEEMADVLEVLIALCRLEGSSLRNLERLAARKRRKVGGFGKGLMLVQTEELPLLEIRSGSGLFNTQSIKASRDSYQAIVAAGRRLKARRDRIIIPLIPSIPNRLRGPSRIYFRNPDVEFEVWYREKTVEVILVGDKADTSSQLVLPFDSPNLLKR
ncbi:MAG: nucleoside triphosphate pyrophosphohydrolase [Acidobacteriia bacterium]|nr:nucleoside triphosphate pyrophosphohydrolase [Terriglobia bacterium]